MAVFTLIGFREVCCETAMRLVPAAATHELQDGQKDINCIEVDGK